MEKQGLLTVISGFSGAGKGTLVNRLLQDYPQEYCLSVSMTTRAPRAGEKDGVHYFFVSKEKFEETISCNGFLEHACYVGNYYGTPKHFVQDRLNQGVNVILEIEMQGAFMVRDVFPEALLLFITPPSAGELAKRLQERGTETPEQIRSRLSRAAEETVYMKDYDYVVVNDNLSSAVRRLHEIITNEKDRAFRRTAFIASMTEDLQAYTDIGLSSYM